MIDRFRKLAALFLVIIGLGGSQICTADQCPAGFEPNEQGCSDSERAAGCQDIRLDDGTGCVNFVESEVDADEQCPAGFSEDDSGCSDDERAEGCRDIRLDNGTGCVSR